LRISRFVLKNLLEFCFIITEDKCDWLPRLQSTWLGYTWFLDEGVVRVTTERLDRLIRFLTNTWSFTDQGKFLFKVRWVVSLIGQIISTQIVFGSQERLRTKDLYVCVLTRASWN